MLSLHTPSTPGVGSKGHIFFSFLKVVMLHIKLKWKKCRPTCKVTLWILNKPLTSGVGFKVSKDAKIRNRYNQVPHLTQDTNGKVTNSQLDTTNESQEVSPFPAGDHKAHINRRAHRHSKHKTDQKHKKSTKEVVCEFVTFPLVSWVRCGT